MGLPGGSPGPHARIPPNWQMIIIIAAIIATLVMGLWFKLSMDAARQEMESDEDYEDWLYKQAMRTNVVRKE